jgi:hypothetical protein
MDQNRREESNTPLSRVDWLSSVVDTVHCLSKPEAHFTGWPTRSDLFAIHKVEISQTGGCKANDEENEPINPSGTA